MTTQQASPKRPAESGTTFAERLLALEAPTLPADLREPLEKMIHDLRRDHALNDVGQAGAEMEIARALRVMDALPATDPAPLSAIVIAGLPRTGTTFLHHYLAGASTLRRLSSWEALDPSCRSLGHENRARAEARDRFDLACALAPRLQELHPLAPGGVEECTPLLQNTLRCHQWSIMFEMPSYAAWLTSADMDLAYRRWAGQLELIDPGARWVLKSPMHVGSYASLDRRLGPDSLIVQIRRDPLEVMTSLLNLIEEARSLFYDEIDTHSLGQAWLRFVEDLCRRSEAHDINTPRLILDNSQLRRRPDQALRRILKSMPCHLARTFSSNPPPLVAGLVPVCTPRLHPIERYGLTSGDVRRRLGSFASFFC